MLLPVFVQDWVCEIELHQTGVICIPWRQQSWSCSVFKSWISDSHWPSQWKSSTQLWYIRASAGRCVFQWDRLLGEFCFWCDVEDWANRSALISVTSNVFLMNVVNYIVEIFHNISGPTVWCSKLLTRALLHPIFNSLLTPDTACESQATACDNRQQPVTSKLAWTCYGLVSTVFSRKIYFLCIDQYFF